MTTRLEMPTMRPRDEAGRPRWRRLTGIILFIHGAIHLLGVWWAFDPGEVAELGGPTLLVTGQGPGDPAIMAFGVAWLVAAIGFMIAGTAVTVGWQRSRLLAGGAAAISLVPTIVWWNDAWIGAVVSAVVLLSVAFPPRIAARVARVAAVQGGAACAPHRRAAAPHRCAAFRVPLPSTLPVALTTVRSSAFPPPCSSISVPPCNRAPHSHVPPGSACGATSRLAAGSRSEPNSC